MRALSLVETVIVLSTAHKIERIIFRRLSMIFAPYMHFLNNLLVVVQTKAAAVSLRSTTREKEKR